MGRATQPRQRLGRLFTAWPLPSGATTVKSFAKPLWADDAGGGWIDGHKSKATARGRSLAVAGEAADQEPQPTSAWLAAVQNAGKSYPSSEFS
jgi:hypothetical protein